jgi:hypothetical protein
MKLTEGMATALYSLRTEMADQIRIGGQVSYANNCFRSLIDSTWMANGARYDD